MKQQTSPNSYQVLAPVYDRWQRSYGKSYSAHILPRLLSSIDQLQIPTSTVLDVACGTGSLAVMMAKRGWNVIGVDGAEAMIAQARKKVRNNSQLMKFVHQDVREMSLDMEVPLATCFFDSLNHLLTEDDVIKALKRIHEHLSPNGWFIFDTNNLHCFETIWTGQQTFRLNRYKLVLTSHYDPVRRIAQCEVMLRKTAEENRDAASEVVVERFYTHEEIGSMVAQAGFRLHSCEEFNFTSIPEVGEIKTWWIVQKQN